MIDLTDYKELYFSLFRATEKAISILIDAQRNAEEIILSEEVRDPAQGKVDTTE